MRAAGVWVIAVLGGLALVTPGRAVAETLVDQPPGPSGVAVPSEGTPERLQPFDDFDVPAGTHWRLEGIRVFGQAANEHPRTFEVKILGGGPFPLNIPDERIFSERVTVAGGPDYLIPIEGAALEHEHSLKPGQYWFSVYATGAGEEEDWSWLTGPDTPGTVRASLPTRETETPSAEPGLAFQLLGTATQIVGTKTYGPGMIVSDPPGISCPGTCVAEFPRGTTVTFDASATNPSARFTEWGFRNTGFTGPSNALVPIQIPSPCGGDAGCTVRLNADAAVGAVFDPINEVIVLRVVHHRAGRGELLVWAPGEGVLAMESPGVRSYIPGAVPAGLVRLPLIPKKRIARTLRRKGRVTVSVEVEFRATAFDDPKTMRVPVTLVGKPPVTPAHKLHSVRE